MIRKPFFFLLCLWMGAFQWLRGQEQRQSSALSVRFLRCEYLVDPLGIDNTHPRLSWLLQSDSTRSGARGSRQSAYQILIASSPEKLNEAEADLWNTHKVLSEQQKQVVYKGKDLSSRNDCYWKVRVWNGQRRVSAWSEPAHWSIGLLYPSDWKGQWIGAPAIPHEMWNTRSAKAHSGFHSAFVDGPDSVQTVTLAIGSAKWMDEVRLYPASPVGTKVEGYLFPLRFYIEIASDKNFSHARRIVDETAVDSPVPAEAPLIFHIEPVKAAYIRLVCLKESESVFNKSHYAFALAELELRYKNDRIQVAGPVSSPGAIESESDGWGPDRLVDGITGKVERAALFNPPMTPSPLLRKEFSVRSGIRKAMLYTSALGLSEITINGKKVGDHILAPEWTDYHTRVQYQSYEVTGLLDKDRNTLGATLADGWYIGPVFSFPARGAYGYNRRLLAQLEIEYINGEKQVIATDGSWKIFSDGPLRAASIYDGEILDENKLPEGWAHPGFDDSRWASVTVDSTVRIILSAQMNEPVKVVKELPVVKISQTGPDTYIYDMGQNMVGWCHISIPGYRGDSVRLRYGEVLNENGALYTDNLRGARQTDRYIGPSANEAVIEPRFTYHGFRYLEIKGIGHELPPGSVTGKVIASSARETGSFECSSKDLNQLWRNILWTQMGNIPGVPTDCPQRDERAGWMGDAQVFSQTGIFNMDMAAFFTKWVRDIRDSQDPNGSYADFSPMVGYDKSFYNAPGWADAGMIIPWRLYENYGDKRILLTHFASMRKFIDHLDRLNPDHIWRKGTGMGYGDWLNGNTIVDSNYPKSGGAVPLDVYATAFYAYSTELLARMARVIGESAAWSRYHALSGQIRAAFNRQFVKGDALIEGDTQAGYALALSFDLLPEGIRSRAAERMAAAVHRYDDRVSTGIQTTIRMMNELSAYGYTQLAYKLIESDRFPSWIYSIRQGATTIWERWDGYVKGRGFQNIGMNSFNHYAIGAVGEWMYKTILGIRPDTTAPGFSRFLIEPEPGGSLRWAKGSYESINGAIRVQWEIKQDHFNLHVSVPPNTTALIRIPRVFVNGAGNAGKPAARFTESGRPVKMGNGILSYREDKEYEWVSAGSGEYAFSLRD